MSVHEHPPGQERKWHLVRATIIFTILGAVLVFALEYGAPLLFGANS